MSEKSNSAFSQENDREAVAEANVIEGKKARELSVQQDGLAPSQKGYLSRGFFGKAGSLATDDTLSCTGGRFSISSHS